MLVSVSRCNGYFVRDGDQVRQNAQSECICDLQIDNEFRHVGMRPTMLMLDNDLTQTGRIVQVTERPVNQGAGPCLASHSSRLGLLLLCLLFPQGRSRTSIGGCRKPAAGRV